MDRYQKAQMAGADAFKRGASVIDCPHSGRLGAHWRLLSSPAWPSSAAVTSPRTRAATAIPTAQTATAVRA